jgi:hypothetical protein
MVSPMGEKVRPANGPVEFDDSDIELITQTLPQGVAQGRLELLPQILHEWGRTDVPRHLSVSPRAIRERTKTVDVFIQRARDLLEADNALDEPARRRVAYQIAGYETVHIEKAAINAARQDLDATRGVLTRLAALGSRVHQKPRRGQPRNYSAYLVMLDIAAIFEWLTETKAGRQVDREGKGGLGDVGPFWEFAAVLWPRVFPEGKSGLTATMKNWARYIRTYDEGSAVIANIAFRHPTWRLFED